MGRSLDAYLAYGFYLGGADDGELPWDDTDDDNEEWMARILGWEPTEAEPYCWSWLKENGNILEVDLAGTDEYSMWSLVIKESIVDAYYEVKRLPDSALMVHESWRPTLERFAQKAGIKDPDIGRCPATWTEVEALIANSNPDT